MNDSRMPAQNAEHASASRTNSGFRLSKRGSQALLAVHITLACVWVGALVVVLLLVSPQFTNAAEVWRPGFDRAVLLVFDIVLVNASYGFVITGLLFSLCTDWGVFRYWWIILKWLLLAAFGLALPLWVAPHISSLTALSDVYSGDVSSSDAYAFHSKAVLLTTLTQLLVLVGVVVLSVFKPWGRRKTKRLWPRTVSITIAALVLSGLALQLWVQNVQLAGYRRQPVLIVDVSTLSDGEYEGSDTQAGFTYRVRVSVADGRIARVDVLSNRDTLYAELAALVTYKLLQRRSNDIDAISGATTTSNGLMRAVSNALENARKEDAVK